jgi:hypothetical protein
MWRSSLKALMFLTLLAPSMVFAWPNGPDEDPRLDPPNDPGYAGQWNLWSHVPEEWSDNEGFREEEIALGTGLSADRAWQITTGDRRVLIAVLDSGVYWDNADLVNKYYLNRGELAECKPTPMADPPEGADDFDVDGSGWFDIRDYAASGSLEDALAKWDTNKNGMLDPQDLIQKCSDGKDDDGNGYIDDISGWDFFSDDNDAYDDTRFGHGNGEARDSVAEGNNGMGDIGVCPDCTALMVRVGDSFVVDANDFGQGVVFATDSGASVIQEALGSVNNTAFSQDAINYAYDNNVVVIASAADELSYHHNFPGTNNHTVYVHAIQYDGASASQSTTYLNFNNCTNYGMQLLLSTPGLGCSSEATGITAGHAGLLYAAALKAGLGVGDVPPISAEEIKQVITLNVDDIDVNPDDSDPTKFPSTEGWDWHFGYGRNNARKSVDAIVEGRIPPEVDIVRPLWFEVLYPDRTPTVEITGRINKRQDGLKARFDSVDWVVEYALGVAPLDKDFKLIGEGTTEGMDGTLVTWDVTKVTLDLDKPLKDSHQNAVTVRLRATGKLKDGSSITGEHRKGFLLERDPDLLGAFPIRLGSSGEASPVFADLDGDGVQELVLSLADGTLHAYKSDGTEADGFPVNLHVRRAMNPDFEANARQACAFKEDKEGCIAQVGTIDPDVKQTMMMPPAVGDLDGDGTLEIVITTWDGYVYIFEHDGTARQGWPNTVDWSLKKKGKTHITDSGFFASPVLYDMDNDGDLEIICAAMDQYIYVWQDDGSVMAPYPVRVGSSPVEERTERIVCTPAIGDIDGDGKPEIALGTAEVFGAKDASNEAVAYVINAETGEVADGWPQSLYGLMVDVLPVVGRGVPTNPILADLDYDGKLEVSFDTISTQGWIFRSDGSIYKKMNNKEFGIGSDSTDSPVYVLMNNGAMGYIDPEGGLDFVKGTAGFDFALAFAGGGTRGYFDHQLSGWDTDTGRMLEGFPRVMDDWQFFNTPTIVDLNNDTDPEVVIGSGGYLVHSWNYKGEEPAGWPKQTGGWIIASVAVGEFDGDGLFEVAVTTRDGWLYVWDTVGKVGSIFEWSGFGHDPHNTNNYEMPATPYQTWDSTPVTTPDTTDADVVSEDTGSTPAAPTEDSGCRTAQNSMPLLWLMALLLWLGFMRRTSVSDPRG